MDLYAPFQKVPHNGDFDFKLKDPKTLIVTVKKGQQLNQVFNFLSEQGIKVLSMRNETGRLEELFISLTESNIDKTSLLDSPVGEKD